MKDRATWLKELKYGDKIWCAMYNRHEHVAVVCPVCFGKREVTLILGNDDHVVLPCAYCSCGSAPPTGMVKEYQTVAKPELRAITKIEIKQTSKGEERRYNTCHNYWDDSLIFQTEAEAAKKAVGLAAKDMEEQVTRAKNIKKNHWHNYSWNAGYHMREANNQRKGAERHDALAKICKDRSKTMRKQQDDH